jgi:hypothetical protein
MISEVGTNSKCLDVKQLEFGMEDIKFCKISKIIQKFTIEGRPYLRMTIKDINGLPIVGRMFEGVSEFLNDWTTWNNAIVLAHFSTSNYMNRLSLDIISINKPDAEMQALLNEESFDATYTYLEQAINVLNNVTCEDTELNSSYHDLLQSSLFESMLYYSADNILGNQNGGIIALISLTSESLKSYQSLHIINDNEVVVMLMSLIIVQSVICSEINGNPILNNIKVLHKVFSKTTIVSKYKELFSNCMMSYCNLCLGFKDNVSPLAKVLYGVYNEKLESTNLITVINSCTKKSGDCLEIDGNKYYKD